MRLRNPCSPSLTVAQLLSLRTGSKSIQFSQLEKYSAALAVIIKMTIMPVKMTGTERIPRTYSFHVGGSTARDSRV